MNANAQTVETPSVVTVSNRGTLVNFDIDDGVSLEVACRALREHLGRFSDLFASGAVTVNIGRRLLSDRQRQRIQKVIQSESGLSVRQFWCDPAILEAERTRIAELIAGQSWIAGGRLDQGSQMDQGSRDEDSPIDGSPIADCPAADCPAADDLAADVPDDDAPEPDVPADGLLRLGGLAPEDDRTGAPAWIVRGTFRAGEAAHIPGSVVILGNVNPAAAVVADGDVVVVGALRGLAHAGAAGDATATITAMSAAQPILRIAGYRWEAPDGWNAPDAAPDLGRPGRVGSAAIIAQVRNRAVQVSPYLKNHGINHGGNPNER